jgi:hypothetical protein
VRVLDYPLANESDLVVELCGQIDFLVSEHVRLAGHLADHQRVYWHAYEQSEGASVSARQSDATHASLADWCMVMEVRGEINATAVRIDLLRLLLGSDRRVSQADTFPPDKVLSA